MLFGTNDTIGTGLREMTERLPRLSLPVTSAALLRWRFSACFARVEAHAFFSARLRERHAGIAECLTNLFDVNP